MREVSKMKNNSKKLRDWAPYDFLLEFSDTRAAKYLDVPVEEEYGVSTTGRRWIGCEKYVFNWVVLKNGYAVGMNENPARGLSFPVVRYRKGR